MRILGDISPRFTASFDSPVRTDRMQSSGQPERLDHTEKDISDIPLKITDERYRLECDRLREDEAWQEIRAAHRRASSSACATAVEEPEVPEMNDSGSRIGDAQLDLGSVSNDLAQKHRQQAASELFGSLAYAKHPPRRRTGAPWGVVLVLVMALAGITGYGYLAMRENAIPVRRLPGVQTAIVLQQRLDAVQSRASADLQAARQRSDQLLAAGRERWARLRR
jgi:hypothetical protein